jgi:flagellar basal body-associated protein FliL
LKPVAKSNKQASDKSAADRFALYAAAVVLLFFGIVAVFIYLSRAPSRNDANLSYVELKQTLVNDQGTIARLAVTVQVNTDDNDWLNDNQAALNEQFKKELSLVEVETLRSKEGMEEFQSELKRKFNLEFKTDKVQAVMLTEILLQDQRGGP